jgi:hypothetical protein
VRSAYADCKMNTGIARISGPRALADERRTPHFDASPEECAVLDAQIATTIYLAVPLSGGELGICDAPPPSASSYLSGSNVRSSA